MFECNAKIGLGWILSGKDKERLFEFYEDNYESIPQSLECSVISAYENDFAFVGYVLCDTYSSGAYKKIPSSLLNDQTDVASKQLIDFVHAHNLEDVINTSPEMYLLCEEW